MPSTTLCYLEKFTLTNKLFFIIDLYFGVFFNISTDNRENVVYSLKYKVGVPTYLYKAIIRMIYYSMHDNKIKIEIMDI